MGFPPWFVWQWELGGANGWGGEVESGKIPFCLNRFWEKELMNEGWFRKRWMDGLVKFLSKVRYLLTRGRSSPMGGFRKFKGSTQDFHHLGI